MIAEVGQILFLLGGCDLEMCVIKRILDRYGIKWIDKNLKWGSAISNYKEELERFKGKKIYAVELENDLGINDENIVFIDHHNEYADRPTSLEQVAEIIGHRLSRFEKAVAANDSGYIPALLDMNLSIARIKKIRRLDRICQSISPEEEKAAENVELKKIIYFNHEHFSPVCDRIFFEKGWLEYIIYNDKLTMFYGFDIKKLKIILKEKQIAPSFSGGGRFGFVGVNRKIDKTVLKEIYAKMKTAISNHIFMFPFVIKQWDDFNEKIEDTNRNWVDDKLNFNKTSSYNEFAYFFPQIRYALYGSDDDKKNQKLTENKIYNFHKGEYTIDVIGNENENKKSFTLELEKITLSIFNKSIGILSFHLQNFEYSYNDILLINDFGRRVYPQFLDENSGIDQTKNSFLADKITLSIDGNKPVSEEFLRFKNIKNNSMSDIEQKMIPGFIEEFVGRSIKPIIDDRMFVVSFVLDRNEKIIPHLKNFDEKKRQYGYLSDDWWYKFVFVDGKDKTCQSKIACGNLIENATYDRWIEYGTLWGISRYSFVGISSWDLMMVHAKTIYYKVMMLLLMYRAMVIYLSGKVQKIVENIREGEPDEKIHNDSQKVYKEYLEFLNGLYFREITPQEQGIELFEKAFSVMKIETMIKDFDREIEELDNYIKFRVEKKRNNQMDMLTKIGYYLLPPSLVAGFLGMNVGNFSHHKSTIDIILLIFAIIFSFVIGLIVRKIMDKNKDKEATKKKKGMRLIKLFSFVLLCILEFLLLVYFISPITLQISFHYLYSEIFHLISFVF